MYEEDSIGIEEVVEAIAKLKSGKAPGVCGIDAEMLKAGGMLAAEWLHRVIEVTWAKGEVANDWKKAVIVPLHKKGYGIQGGLMTAIRSESTTEG